MARSMDCFVASLLAMTIDRKSTRLNSSHQIISYAVFCLKKKKTSHNSKHKIISYVFFSLKKIASTFRQGIVGAAGPFVVDHSTLHSNYMHHSTSRDFTID